MNRPDSGPGLDQGGDRNLRPRRASTTRTFFDPSPSASSARHPRPPTSSAQANTHYYTRTASGSLPSGQRSEKDDSDGSSETGGEQLQEVSKLEIKREKNRLKQRNLRQRRNNYISGLEEQVRHLKRDCTTFRDHISTKATIVAANETKYGSWINGLENVLLRQGLGDEVQGLRQAWGSSIQDIPAFPHSSNKSARGGKKGKAAVKVEPMVMEDRSVVGQSSRIEHPPPQQRSSMSTLVQAAMTVEPNHLPSPSSLDNTLLPSYASHYQQPTSARQMRAPPPPDLSISGNQLGSKLNPITLKSNPPVIYPGSMEALRQPPSPSRDIPRARNIPSSARSLWEQQQQHQRPSISDSLPPAPEDRKRKRSLSGPNLHSSSYPSFPPSMFSYSAPNSGQVNQALEMSSQGVPALASLPVLASRSMTRPSSSQSVGQSAPSAWNTLAPFRLQPTSSSRPSTPSSQQSQSQPFSTLINNPSPGHMRISDLLVEKSERASMDRQLPIPIETQQKSRSWPLPQGHSIKSAMPLSDLLSDDSTSSQGAPSKTRD